MRDCGSSSWERQPRQLEGVTWCHPDPTSGIHLRASITVGGEQAESSLAEREKERERAASVLRDAGLKRAKTHSLRSHSLLSCCASFLFAACAAGKLLPHLLKATLEFIRRRTSCIINHALISTSPRQSLTSHFSF